eukprot:CAMPEP_0118850130 /NCGR_PEP_ID=MMETSP1163-20130328/132_1 /TAXON_ID=124430 /ORGANISM="Phaeomonas parva, Strain CCMP2877" /LENGTH=277 /DNA_ID=CAMNT_0006782331 /DNA_START=100 /DNA_END=930 /DNA_ORIENTATION=+
MEVAAALEAGEVDSTAARGWNVLLHALAARGELDAAERVFREDMVAAGVAPDADTFAALLLAALPAGDAAKATELFQRMRVFKVKPDAGAYGAYIRALVAARDMPAARRALYAMQQALPLSAQTADAYNGFLKGLLREATHRDANTEEFWDYFRFMRMEGIDPNVETYIYAAKACARKGQVEKALLLLEEMKAFSVPPTPAFFTEVLRAAGRSPQYVPENANIVQEVLETMAGVNVLPDAGVFAAAMNALGTAGDAAGAEALYAMMPKYGIAPSRHH